MNLPAKTYYLMLIVAAVIPLACDDSVQNPKPLDGGSPKEASTRTDQTVASDIFKINDRGVDHPADITAGKDRGGDQMTGDQMTGDQMAGDQMTPDQTGPDAGPSYPVPVAYWSMDQAHISGATLEDHVGIVDGTITGATKDSIGQVGQALALNGTGDFIDFGNQLNNVFAGADKTFSVSLWVKPASLNTNVVLISKNGDASCDPDEDQRGWLASLSSVGKPIFAFQPLIGGSAQLISVADPLAGAGAWTHLFFVYDGSVDSAPGDRVTIYVNGVAQAETPISTGSFPFDLALSTAHLSLGVRLSATGATCTDSGAGFFAGSVDELAIWDSALSEVDAVAIFSRGQNSAPLIP